MPSHTAANEVHHRLHVNTVAGPIHVRAEIELSAPWTVIFGPSGSGKTTLLRAACGLLPLGSVEFSSRALPEQHWRELETRHSAVPPNLRAIAYAPQSGVLFPHLTVAENISFPLQARKLSATNITEILGLFDLTKFANRLPKELSGGQRQRVNLARAFAVPHPSILLLDEPFTGIDRKTRAHLLTVLRDKASHAQTPVLSVTHDVEEALLLDASVIRLDRGSVIDAGPAHQVLAAERNSMLQTLRLAR